MADFPVPTIDPVTGALPPIVLDDLARRFDPKSPTPRPQNLTGTYAARPTASSVPVGSTYYASNTLETYRSTGTTWMVVGAGGSELAYAETLTNTAVTAGSAMQDVPGVAISIVQPERPLYLECKSVSRYVPTTTPRDAVIAIYETTTATPVLVVEAHAPAAANANEYPPLFDRRRMPAATPGTTRTFKLSVQQRADAYTLFAAAAFPTWIGAFTS